MRYDFKGNFDLEGLERVLKKLARITCRILLQPSPVIRRWSAGFTGKLKSDVQHREKYDIPVVMDSARFAENAYFISSVKQNTKTGPSSRSPAKPKICRYAGDVRQERCDGADGRLLCMKDDSFFDVYTECRTLWWCRKASRHMAAWKAALWSVCGRSV